MILSDFECPKCGESFEQLCNSDETTGICLACGCEARRIISLGRVYMGNQDATWLKSVLDVVDKDNQAPHVQAFVKNPNRANYKAWMKGEGIRPADHTERGAPPIYSRPEQDSGRLERITREVMAKRQARNSINMDRYR